MNIEVNSVKITFELIDKETGEVITKEATLKDIKDKKPRTSRSKKPEDNDPVAKITLLEGKYQFNKSAIELTEFEPEMKIDIKFEKNGRLMIPVLCEDVKSGNRLTKSYTVSCKGSKRENLEAYGTVFELIPYPDKEGYFKLKGNKELPEDDIIDIPEEINDPDKDEFEIDNLDIDDVDFTLDD